TAYVLSSSQVFQTTNAGNTWTDVTGNLASVAQAAFRSISYSNVIAEGMLIAGTDNGVFAARGPSFANWSVLGTGLPNAPVYHVEFSPVDGVILAGTLGRGAWILDLSSLKAVPS